MFSISIDKCNSPRPETLKPSLVGNSSTSSPTLRSSSAISLSLKCLEVTNLPTLPANGLLLTIKFIDNVGFSISIFGRGSTWLTSQIVSPIDISGQPATITISPKYASLTSLLLIPSLTNILVILSLVNSPLFLEIATVSPTLILPLLILPIPSLPI